MADQPPSTAPTSLLTAFIKSVAIVVSVHLQTVASQRPFMMIQSLGNNSIRKAVDVFKILKKVLDDDPRRGTHCLKVALAIAFVSSVYYIRPLYKGGIGNAAITATLVVISVSEYTAGGTSSKCMNNAYATVVGCALGVGAEFLGGLVGPTVKPVLLASLVVLVVAAVTFSRFIPSIKKRYDYGAFTFVAMSGHRVHGIIQVAHRQASAISLGALTSLAVSTFVFPVWAGEDLHKRTVTNMEKLASFLEGFGGEYYRLVCEGDKPSLEDYKSILDSDAAETEKSLANSAWWEIRWYGKFRYDHPWEQYLKIGELSRECAYHIEALSGYLDEKVPSAFQITVQEPCMKMSSEVGKALKDLGNSLNLMEHSCASVVLMKNCNMAADDLNMTLKASLIGQQDDILKAIPVIAATSLLVDIIKCVEKISEAIQGLSKEAGFKIPEPDV